MAIKPETSFIQKIHAGFTKSAAPYHLKLCLAFTAGVADAFYSGDRGDMWIEYKYIPRIPINADIRPDLSSLQRMWLAARSAEGRRVFVIVGTPLGGVILHPHEFDSGIPVAKFRERLLPPKAIADWITTNVGVSACPSRVVPAK